MTGCQIVDADCDDRVQDDDLTQKHDFRLGTIGAEEVPTRCNNLVVVVVRNVCPFAVFFDGGHRWNEESTGA